MCYGPAVDTSIMGLTRLICGLARTASGWMGSQVVLGIPEILIDTSPYFKLYLVGVNCQIHARQSLFSSRAYLITYRRGPHTFRLSFIFMENANNSYKDKINFLKSAD